MLDVHPPHDRIHGIRDFLLHLLTITIGLLIALSLEALVEHIHHLHVVREAKDSIAAEVADNRKELETVLPILAQERETNDVLLGLLQEDRRKQPHSSTTKLDFEGATLNQASYATAQSNGAIALMPYPEAKQLADVYELQSEFMAEQRETFQLAAAPLFGSFFSKGLPVDQMDQFQLERAEEQLELYTGHLLILQGIGRQLDAAYKRF